MELHLLTGTGIDGDGIPLRTGAGIDGDGAPLRTETGVDGTTLGTGTGGDGTPVGAGATPPRVSGGGKAKVLLQLASVATGLTEIAEAEFLISRIVGLLEVAKNQLLLELVTAAPGLPETVEAKFFQELTLRTAGLPEMAKNYRTR